MRRRQHRVRVFTAREADLTIHDIHKESRVRKSFQSFIKKVITGATGRKSEC
jgi:hypothetical protein